MFGNFLSDAIINYEISINGILYQITKPNVSLETAISLYNRANNSYIRHRFGVLCSEPMPAKYDECFLYDSSFVPSLRQNGIVLRCSNPGFDNIVVSFIDGRYVISSGNPTIFYPFLMPKIGDTAELVNQKYVICQANNGNQEEISLQSLIPEKGFIRHRFGKIFIEMPNTEDDPFFSNDSSFILQHFFGKFLLKCTNSGLQDHYVVVNPDGGLEIKPQSEIMKSENCSLATRDHSFQQTDFRYEYAYIRLLTNNSAMLTDQRLIQSAYNISEIEHFCSEMAVRISHVENKLDACISYNLKLLNRIKILEDFALIQLNHQYVKLSPLLSIVIPVYNEEKYISSCLNSLLSQTFSSFEIIIVNDGSTDRTGEILADYSSRDPRISIINVDHKGAGEARNIGLANVKGKYISILDADDEYDPKMLTTMYSQAASDNLDIMVCRSERITGDDEDSREKMAWTIAESCLPRNRVFSAKDCSDYIFQIFNGWTWDKLFSADFVRKTGLRFQNTAFSNDAKFTFTALCSANRISVTNEYLVTHRYHDSSIEARRYEDPVNFIEAFRAILAWLNDTGNVSHFGLSFKNWVVSFTRWQYETTKTESCKEKIVNAALEFVKECGIAEKLTRIYKAEDTLWFAKHFQTSVPEVSVIMPVFNSELYLEETIGSLAAQTMGNFEVICIDDGSQDRSFEILMNTAKLDKRFRIVRQDNNGAGAARNKGLDLAKGRYLAFIDSDDTYSPTFLEKMLCKARHFDLDVVICRYIRFFDKYNTEDIPPRDINVPLLPKKEVFSLPDIKENFFQLFIPVVWNKIFKREFIQRERIRFQEIINSNDTLFVYTALLSASAVSTIDERLIRYRMRADSLVRTRRSAPDCYLAAQDALKNVVTYMGLLNDEGFRNSFNLRIKQNTEWNKKMIAQ